MVRIRLSLALTMSACISAAAPVAAHDWYPRECCHGMDCAPVEHARVIGPAINLPGPAANAAGGTLEVTTRHGTAVVPPNMVRRESKDHRMHACLRRSWYGKMTVICIFVPPSM